MSTGRESTGTNVLNEPTQLRSSTIMKKQKKSSRQKGKLIPKPKHLSFAKDFGKIEPNILAEEIKGLLTSQFSDSKRICCCIVWKFSATT